ncbi:MAG: DUF2948 family protein, partial [Pseudomonadota bacterium]
FNWMDALKADNGKLSEPRNTKDYERRQCALRFEQVRGVQLQNIDLKDTRRVLSMLALSFEPLGGDTPEGHVLMLFAGGAALRLDVEYVECELRDLGGAWATRSRPQHAIVNDAADGDD